MRLKKGMDNQEIQETVRGHLTQGHDLSQKVSVLKQTLGRPFCSASVKLKLAQRPY